MLAARSRRRAIVRARGRRLAGGAVGLLGRGRDLLRALQRLASGDDDGVGPRGDLGVPRLQTRDVGLDATQAGDEGAVALHLYLARGDDLFQARRTAATPSWMSRTVSRMRSAFAAASRASARMSFETTAKPPPALAGTGGLDGAADREHVNLHGHQRDGATIFSIRRLLVSNSPMRPEADAGVVERPFQPSARLPTAARPSCSEAAMAATRSPALVALAFEGGGAPLDLPIAALDCCAAALWLPVPRLIWSMAARSARPRRPVPARWRTAPPRRPSSSAPSPGRAAAGQVFGEAGQPPCAVVWAWSRDCACCATAAGPGPAAAACSSAAVAICSAPRCASRNRVLRLDGSGEDDLRAFRDHAEVRARAVQPVGYATRGLGFRRRRSGRRADGLADAPDLRPDGLGQGPDLGALLSDVSARART